ncbi:signal peptidase I [Thalassotalea piscium]|uniref:Signal peptidase I n=1 Tax=Thalassotalea piscium TaxID=1230533 RepID=A0A7X0TTF2_9GAMM|nr:signal peptidase I [Thalassotalea piscium]MBB6543059.1 signal peptidase I [Thalassotalea piscium]
MTKYLLSLLIVSIVYLVYHYNIRPAYLIKRYGEDEKALKPKFEGLSWYMLMLLISSSTLLFVKTFLYEFATVPSQSMMPSFTVGQRVLIDKNEFGFRNPLNNLSLTDHRTPKRGEPIITQFPLNPQIMFIKRIVGLPGDVITLNKEYLQVNDIKYPFNKVDSIVLKVDKDMVKHDQYQVRIGDFSWNYIVETKKEFPTISQQRVPENGYYLLGDNLTGSSDSRSFGSIPSGYFIGSIK